jgi:predicted oxidoreductase
MKSSRIKECVQGMDIKLSREEWYAIYLSAGNILP